MPEKRRVENLKDCWFPQRISTSKGGSHFQVPTVFYVFGGVDCPCFWKEIGLPFSRMRSEGFPFIVGVWGWTCVRFVLLPRRRVVVDSSSCRRRVVVASSSRRRRVVVANSLISLYWALGGTFALRHHPVFQSMKSGGSLA